MLTRAPIVDQAVTRLVRRELTKDGIHGLGRAALRTGAPKLLDVLALRASEERLDAVALAAALEASGGWPDRCLAHPHEALALATIWAVGDAALRRQALARRAYRDLLDRLGPEPFATGGQAAHLFAQLALLAGDRVETERLLRVLPLGRKNADDLRIDLANPYAAPGQDPAAWLRLFNARFRDAGLAPITVEATAEHPFDGLHAPTGESVDGPLVSVIVPSFRPEPAGLINSIRSMRAQTYGNLEILLVDDASGPEFAEVYAAAAALDDRVRIVRMPVNGGSYLGRNAAIDQARGRYLTTQDADDWSHPGRIAEQVALLEAKPFAPASRSDAIRALDDLTLTWLGYPSQRRNASSFMVRRSTIETIGVFDTVRKGADSEYHERVERRLGPILDTSTPLAITRLRGGSLSRADFRMLWMNPDRALYRTAYRGWHDQLSVTSPPLVGNDQLRRRAFPAAHAFRRALPGAPVPRTEYDVVYLADLAARSALTGGPNRALMRSRAITSAVIFQEDPTRGLARPPIARPAALDPVLRHRIDLISASDVVSARVLVVLTPGLLEMPSLDTPHVRANQICVLLTNPVGGAAPDLLAIRDGGREVFECEVEFIAQTPAEAAEWSLDLDAPIRSLTEVLESFTDLGGSR